MSPTLRGLYEQAQTGANLVVTGPHVQWLERLEHEQVPNAKALAFVIRALLHDFKHPRPGRFSPSSMGECPRRIVFEHAGAPQLPPDIDNQEMMDHGTISHLKWQIEGLTMGYMREAEVWVEDPDLWVGGSIDAELADASLFECKTVHPFVYNKIVLDTKKPKWEALLQIGTYFMLHGADWASVVYEDRGGGQFHEFRIERDDKIEREVLRRLKSYKSYVEADELPPQLADCEIKIGTVFRRCAFREICHVPKTYSQSMALPVIDAPGQVPLAAALPDWAQRAIAFAHELEES